MRYVQFHLLWSARQNHFRSNMLRSEENISIESNYHVYPSSIASTVICTRSSVCADKDIARETTSTSPRLASGRGSYFHISSSI